jgi:ketosteroid isomerase-like protein
MRLREGEEHMKMLVLAALTVLWPVFVGPSVSLAVAGALAQTSSGLSGELEALHAQWFKAFDAGDGAAMDQMEVDNLVLVMPTGMAWSKDGPRAGKQAKRDPSVQRTLSDVAVRQFGDSAVLTGTVTSKSATETDKVGTTVVFVRRAGKWLIASAQWTPVEAAK